jgi:hypothetical protein
VARAGRVERIHQLAAVDRHLESHQRQLAILDARNLKSAW